MARHLSHPRSPRPPSAELAFSSWRVSTVATERPAGYNRALFVLWVDADHDGCNTREEVLISESRTAPRIGAGCAVRGSWRSAYDGLTSTHGSAFDIDHVVPLKEAWDSGAYGWTAARRLCHAAASILLEQGVDPRYVQDVLGHADEGMTRRYQHVAPTSTAAADAMDRALSRPVVVMVAVNEGGSR